MFALGIAKAPIGRLFHNPIVHWPYRINNNTPFGNLRLI